MTIKRETSGSWKKGDEESKNDKKLGRRGGSKNGRFGGFRASVSSYKQHMTVYWGNKKKKVRGGVRGVRNIEKGGRGERGVRGVFRVSEGAVNKKREGGGVI